MQNTRPAGRAYHPRMAAPHSAVPPPPCGRSAGRPRCWSGGANCRHVRCPAPPAMTKMEASVDVKVPAEAAYNQWTQFEEFPRFMPHVERVRQIDDRHLHWEAKMAGKTVEWDAEIVEQIPDKRIAWRSISGAHHAGVVTFHRLADDKCRVMLQLEWEPEGADE